MKETAITFAPLVLLLVAMPPYMEWMFSMRPPGLLFGYALVGGVAASGAVGAWLAHRLINRD